MTMIQANKLTFSYPSGAENIFEDVSFQIDTDWKLGLIGRNGRGKTTFLNLLLGKYEYSGKITASVQFDYFPFLVPDKTVWTSEILEEICPEAEQWEFMRELNELEADPEILYRPFETLSNGEQTKALLAAMTLNEGHFLLIDEPTNHLDLRGRETVAAYLKRKKGFILVSHDRTFLDGCIDHIMSINRTDIEIQKGNFSSWQENRERQERFENASNEKLKKEIRRLADAARRNSDWSDAAERSKKGTDNSGSKLDRGYIGHKSAKMMKRAKQNEARQAAAIEKKSSLLKNVETADSLKLFPAVYHTDLLVRLSEVSVCFGQNPVCEDLSLEIRQGERIALDGRNGSGKSTILKLITGGLIPSSGTVSVGSGLRISYVPQSTDHLSGSLQGFAQKQEIDESLFLAVLRKLGFERKQLTGDIRDFSAGQKKKILLAGSLCCSAHLYIWDEPLNYLDMNSRMQIEELITAYQPTMIFVEHDRAFREAAATRMIQV